MVRLSSVVMLAAVAATSGCVKGVAVDTGVIAEVLPPKVDFAVRGAGWCGECSDVIVDWEVSEENPTTTVTVEIVFDGATVWSSSDLKGNHTQKVCGKKADEGGTGEAKITVSGVSPGPEPVSLQQSVDGEIRTLNFPPACPFVGAWKDDSFGVGGFPSEVRIDRILNYTFFDTNGNEEKDDGEKTPKIKVSHAPELPEIIVQETWTDLPQFPTLHGLWKATPESLPAFGDRCMEADDKPSEDFAIPLKAKVRVRCFE